MTVNNDTRPHMRLNTPLSQPTDWTEVSSFLSDLKNKKKFLDKKIRKTIWLLIIVLAQHCNTIELSTLPGPNKKYKNKTITTYKLI